MVQSLGRDGLGIFATDASLRIDAECLSVAMLAWCCPVWSVVQTGQLRAYLSVLAILIIALG